MLFDVSRYGVFNCGGAYCTPSPDAPPLNVSHQSGAGDVGMQPVTGATHTPVLAQVSIEATRFCAKGEPPSHSAIPPIGPRSG